MQIRQVESADCFRYIGCYYSLSSSLTPLIKPDVKSQSGKEKRLVPVALIDVLSLPVLSSPFYFIDQRTDYKRYSSQKNK
jgi:hypothetical protein